MMGDKPADARLHLFKIVKGLLCADHCAVHPYRMYDHRTGGHDKRVIRADSNGDTDGVGAAQHKGNGGFADGCDQFCDGKPRLHVAAHGMQQKQ